MRGARPPFDHWCGPLYEANSAELVLYGRALGLSFSEAEDVLQETFLALLKREAPPQEPRRYLLRTFRNRALNFRRTLWRRVWRELESRRWFDPGEGAEDPAELAAMACLQRLPAEQREVIVLKVWHHMTYDEIAGILELSPNTVAGRYRYGMEKLRVALKETDYEQLEPDRGPNAWLASAPAFSPDPTNH